MQSTSDHTSQIPERSIFLPHGRIGRAAYGLRMLLIFAGWFLVGSLQQAHSEGPYRLLANGLSCAVLAFFFVTSIKRLHDMGYGAASVIFLGPIILLLLFAPGECGSNVYGCPPAKPFGGAEGK